MLHGIAGQIRIAQQAQGVAHQAALVLAESLQHPPSPLISSAFWPVTHGQSLLTAGLHQYDGDGERFVTAISSERSHVTLDHYAPACRLPLSRAPPPGSAGASPSQH